MLGLKIVPNTLARDVRTEFKVARCEPYNRKRKRYYVQRIEINRAGCWRVGDTLYMHPELIAAMPEQKPNPYGNLLTPEVLWGLYAE